MKEFFTADTHFGHKGIIEKGLRPGFSSMEEHDALVLENINKTVDREDRLFILGDFAFSNAPSWRGKIRCKNIDFIIGNHDRKEDSRKAFGTYWDIRVLKGGSLGFKRVLCHYPMIYWPASHRGAYHLYGHTHGQREQVLDKFFPDRRSMDVGVDEARRILGESRPFSWDEIYSLIGERKGHDPV